MKKLFSFNQDDFEAKWNINTINEWLSTHKKWILAFFILLFLLLGFLYRQHRVNITKAESNFLEAQVLFAKIQKEPLDTDIEKLQLILMHNPNLRPLYEGPLAQLLLAIQKVEPAAQIEQQLFARIKGEPTQHYQQYTQTSFLIAKKEYSQALTESELLQQNLQEESQLPLLSVFNLVRIALLHQSLGNKEAERDSWTKLQKLTPFLQSKFQLLIDTLQSEQTLLLPYMEERLQLLKQN